MRPFLFLAKIMHICTILPSAVRHAMRNKGRRTLFRADKEQEVFAYEK